MALLDFTTAPHGGRLRLLHPENEDEPRITPRVVILHSIVGGAEGAYRMFRDASSLESHFIVDLDGEIWQLVDTARQADANYKANDFAVSIETADNGDPDHYRWTAAQLDALAWLGVQLSRIHGIPRRRCPDWDVAGYGYHTMFGAPGPWTPVAKSCPGGARIAQFAALLERIQAGETGGISMAEVQQVLTAIGDLRRDLTEFGTLSLRETTDADAAQERQAISKLDAVLNQLGAVSAQLAALNEAVTALAAGGALPSGAVPLSGTVTGRFELEPTPIEPEPAAVPE